MTTTDPALLSAAELLRLYRRKALSPVETAEACLARVRRWNGSMGAFTFVDEEGALAAARASAARWQRGEPCGPLDGVPTTVKDLVLVKGWTARRGSHSTEGQPPAAEDAPATARLREAGAVLLGSTTTPEFGWKAVTDNPLGEIARNPWNPALTPGGSSGGAAVAAALGMGALHLGTDGGGSIRIPAGLTGIVGLKPTFGRVPAWPLSPFGTVAHLGPMTRTVEDAALMLTTISRPDRRDWHALPPEPRDYRIGLEGGLAGLRVAASAALGFVSVDPEVLRVFRSAVATLADLGAEVEETDPPVGDPQELFARTWFPAATRLVEKLPAEARARMDPGLLAIATEGACYGRAELQDAALERGELGVRLQLFFAAYDLLVTPAVAVPAFPVLRTQPGPQADPRWTAWAGLSYPFNLTQQPAISVPAGFTEDGLPVGLQIVAAKYADALVLRAARAFAAACPQPVADTPRSPSAQEPAAPV
ncbi:amidase [Benzoatithermus flavus]|uniref:Amidase n=1 Tax=Benzoatithermus flavus TaxID=3108223 RepID=A0ABU8XNQ0_9PROT